jgi:hypothetical protein
MDEGQRILATVVVVLIATFAAIYMLAQDLNRQCAAAGGYYYHRVCVDRTTNRVIY